MLEWTELSEDTREQAMARFRLLEPHLVHGQELRSLAAGSGVCFRTLQRWVAQYRDRGLIALARQPRHDRGTHPTVSAAMKSTIEGLVLEKPPNGGVQVLDTPHMPVLGRLLSGRRTFKSVKTTPRNNWQSPILRRSS